MSDVLELVLPIRLDSPNKLRWAHWSKLSKESKLFRAAIAAIAGCRIREWSVVEGVEWRHDGKRLRPYEQKRKERRRVTVIREVKQASHFLQDDDNLRFCVKPLNDALKRLGLIYDDSREWLEQPMPEQRVSADKHVRTIVRIERLQEASHAAAV